MSRVQVYVVKHRDEGLKKAVNFLNERKFLDGSELFVEIPSFFNGSVGASDLYKNTKVVPTHYIPLILNGSGSFHHLTYAFCRKIVDKREKESEHPGTYTILHIDQHSDGALTPKKFTRSIIECGHFYPKLLFDSPYAQAVCYLTDPVPSLINSIFHRPKAVLFSLNEKGKVNIFDYKISNPSEAAEKILEKINGKKVFVSLDLDVLATEYVNTDHGNGKMKLEFLLEMLDGLGGKINPVGADICGLKRNGNVGTVFDPKSVGSLETYEAASHALHKLLES